MNTEIINIDELKFDLDNVRKHDDNSIKAIANSLSAFGVAMFPAITSNDVSKSVVNDLLNEFKSLRICFIEE